MNFIEAAIFILFLAIISVPLASRLKVPLEIFLVLGSCLISILIGVPTFSIDPMIVFYLFLPPILFAAAYFTSWRDFKFNLRPIALLALGLVFFTAISVAAVAVWLVPGITWAEGFLLGAIVSPSDASAATALIKKLGAPRRLITIIEGESLVNDATALLLYRFSLAAALLGFFSFHQAIIEFFEVTIGGALVGLLLSIIAIQMLQYIKDVRAETTLTFVLAFTTYLIAERLHLSGVISTVTAGIYTGIKFPEFTSAQTRHTARISWDTLLFVINGFVFALIGLELPWILHGLEEYSVASLILYGLTISFIVIICRLIWIFPAAHIPRMIFPQISHKDPLPQWQFLLALGWTGMRGIVSLAAALAIPLALPERNLIMFLTYCVIITTLIPPVLTLPVLMRLFHIDETENKTKEEAIARLQALQGVIEKVTDLADRERIPCELLKEFRNQLDRRVTVIQTQLAETPYSMLTDEYVALRKLTLTALQSERETLLKLRKDGEIHDDVFRLISDELDIEELRAKTLRI